MNNVIILGAGSHTRSVLSLLSDCGYKIEYIVDINSNKLTDEKINGVKVVDKNFNKNNNFQVLSIGDSCIRESYFSKEKNILSENLIHSRAFLAASAKIGYSNQIFSNVFMNENVIIGDNNIINTGAIVEHESTIGNHNHISIGTVISGRARIADRCFIGANSTIIDKINICSDVIIGAGSVVIKDIKLPGTYVGNPVRKVK